MDPEMLRLAQEQLHRMSPDDLAALQRQVMSNPDLIKLATESMRNLSAEDVRRAAQHLNRGTPTPDESTCAAAQKIASGATPPDELAAVTADAQAVTHTRALKKQGNDLHSRGQYQDAAAKYELAKDALMTSSVASSPAAARALRLQCALNLMACYLKVGRFDECVAEGSDVLAHDPDNVKAYYRRAQAYKELGKLEEAVADLRKASELSPEEDETISEALEDAKQKLGTAGAGSPPRSHSHGSFEPSASSSQATTTTGSSC